jgi:hypothetical protein
MREYETYDPLKKKPWIVIDRLCDIVLAYTKGCVVEIGVGSSTFVLCRHAEKAKVKFYTCDIDAGRCKWIKNRLPYAEVFCGNSFDFMKQFSDIPAVVFIDGNHKYSVVSQEANFFIDRLAVGGVVFIHDTMPWQRTYEAHIIQKKHIPDAHLLRKELEKREDLEVFTWPYTAVYCGLTMVLKKDMRQPEYRR